MSPLLTLYFAPLFLLYIILQLNNYDNLSNFTHNYTCTIHALICTTIFTLYIYNFYSFNQNSIIKKFCLTNLNPHIFLISLTLLLLHGMMWINWNFYLTYWFPQNDLIETTLIFTIIWWFLILHFHWIAQKSLRNLLLQIPAFFILIINFIPLLYYLEIHKLYNWVFSWYFFIPALTAAYFNYKFHTNEKLCLQFNYSTILNRQITITNATQPLLICFISVLVLTTNNAIVNHTFFNDTIFLILLILYNFAKKNSITPMNFYSLIIIITMLSGALTDIFIFLFTAILLNNTKHLYHLYYLFLAILIIYTLNFSPTPLVSINGENLIFFSIIFILFTWSKLT